MLHGIFTSPGAYARGCTPVRETTKRARRKGFWLEQHGIGKSLLIQYILERHRMSNIPLLRAHGLIAR